MLPGGPDESPKIKQLVDSLARTEEAAEKLAAKVVPRPSPPQFPALQAEIQRFAEGLCSFSRTTALMHGLQVNVCLR